MGWRSEGNLGIGAGENAPTGRQTVQVGSKATIRSGEAHAICPGGIESDEDDVGTASGRGTSADGKPANPHQTPEKPHEKQVQFSRSGIESLGHRGSKKPAVSGRL